MLTMFLRRLSLEQEEKKKKLAGSLLFFPTPIFDTTSGARTKSILSGGRAGDKLLLFAPRGHRGAFKQRKAFQASRGTSLGCIRPTRSHRSRAGMENAGAAIATRIGVELGLQRSQTAKGSFLAEKEVCVCTQAVTRGAGREGTGLAGQVLCASLEVTWLGIGFQTRPPSLTFAGRVARRGPSFEQGPIESLFRVEAV